MIALSEDERVRRQLALEWGVVPGRLPPRPHSGEALAALMLSARARSPGSSPRDVVVLAYGPPGAGPGQTSFLAVREVP